MALISCPDCAKQVSDQASACPFCGFPIKQSEAEQNQPSKVLTEQTEFMKRNRGCGDMILYSPFIFVFAIVFLVLVVKCTK